MSAMYATLPAYFIIFDLFLLNTILFDVPKLSLLAVNATVYTNLHCV